MINNRRKGYIIAKTEWVNFEGGHTYTTGFLGKDNRLYSALAKGQALEFKTKGQAKEELSRVTSYYKTTRGWMIIGPNGGVTAY